MKLYKLLSIIVMSALFVFSQTQWRQYNAQKAIVTIDHQMIPTYQTVTIRHFHKVDNKFYVITTDSLEMWVDNIQLIKADK